MTRDEVGRTSLDPGRFEKRPQLPTNLLSIASIAEIQPVIELHLPKRYRSGANPTKGASSTLWILRMTPGG